MTKPDAEVIPRGRAPKPRRLKLEIRTRYALERVGFELNSGKPVPWGALLRLKYVGPKTLLNIWDVAKARGIKLNTPFRRADLIRLRPL